MKIILASTSPRRQEVMARAGIKFKVVPSSYKEIIIPGIPAVDLVKKLARGKAVAVATQHPNDVVVAADTMVMVDNKLCGKPKNKSDAKRILKKLSGKKIKVLSGLAVACLKKNKKIFTDVDIAWVKFKKLSIKEIDDYISTEEPMDKAGAFGIQGHGLLLVDKLDGNYSTIMGLPLLKIVEIFKKLKIKF